MCIYHGTLIFPLTFTPFTHHRSVQKCMNTSPIFDNTMQASRFACLLMKKVRYSNLHKLTFMIAFIIIGYIRDHTYIIHITVDRLWMNFASKVGTNIAFSVCHAGLHFAVEYVKRIVLFHNDNETNAGRGCQRISCDGHKI